MVDWRWKTVRVSGHRVRNNKQLNLIIVAVSIYILYVVLLYAINQEHIVQENSVPGTIVELLTVPVEMSETILPATIVELISIPGEVPEAILKLTIVPAERSETIISEAVTVSTTLPKTIPVTSPPIPTIPKTIPVTSPPIPTIPKTIPVISPPIPTIPKTIPVTSPPITTVPKITPVRVTFPPKSIPKNTNRTGLIVSWNYSNSGPTPQANKGPEGNNDEIKQLSSSPKTPKQVLFKSQGCHIPILNPWDPSLKDLAEVDPQPSQCEKRRYQLLFQTDRNSSLIMLQNPLKFGWSHCCYSQVIRNEYNESTIDAKSKPDDAITIMTECHPIQGTIIKIPDAMEFIAVFCLKNDTLELKRELVDVFAFTPLKPEAENRIAAFEKANPQKRPEDRVNVVILGIDSVSHMNFKRIMPEVEAFMVKNLSAIGMNGYNTVGDASKPNIQAFLSSLNQNELNKVCGNHSRFYDEYPLLWKNYSAEGYRTVYSDDFWGIFNRFQYKGFKKPPADYYHRPLIIASKKIAFDKRPDLAICIGPRLSLRYQLNYMETIAQRMGKDKRYFHFEYTTALTHNNITDGKLAAPYILSFLKLFQAKGYFNNTVFVLMSDHGSRLGEVQLRKQGPVEKNMPLLYLIFPKWFRKKYKRAVDNLTKNRARLTTPYDAHKTLMDLLFLENLDNSKLKSREKELAEEVPRGISLFLPIPESRTCKDAGIGYNWCVCHKTQSVSTKDGVVVEGVKYLVKMLNEYLAPYPRCAVRTLKSINGAEKILHDSKKDVKTGGVRDTHFNLAFITDPSQAAFQAFVTKKVDGEWSISGSISRINRYGNQSYCVDNEIKNYCYCL